MDAQPDLFAVTLSFREARLRDTAAMLEAWLHGRGWQHASDIRKAFPTWNEKLIRDAAAYTDAVISGQRGYHLTDEATPEDIRHFGSWMRSQARKMIGRTLRVGHRFHKAATNHK